MKPLELILEYLKENGWWGFIDGRDESIDDSMREEFIDTIGSTIHVHDTTVFVNTTFSFEDPQFFDLYDPESLEKILKRLEYNAGLLGRYEDIR